MYLNGHPEMKFNNNYPKFTENNKEAISSTKPLCSKTQKRRKHLEDILVNLFAMSNLFTIFFI